MIVVERSGLDLRRDSSWERTVSFNTSRDNNYLQQPSICLKTAEGEEGCPSVPTMSWVARWLSNRIGDVAPCSLFPRCDFFAPRSIAFATKHSVICRDSKREGVIIALHSFSIIEPMSTWGPHRTSVCLDCVPLFATLPCSVVADDYWKESGKGQTALISLWCYFSSY